MIKEILRQRSDILVCIANFCARHAIIVVLSLGILSVAIANYVITNAKVNSDTSEMLSPLLQFRKDFKAYKNSMPAFGPSLVVVIEAPNPDQAEDAARLLSERLRKTDGIKGPVRYLAADPFFTQNGLLYLKRSELDDLANRLSDAQPLLASLSADPSLRGLFGILGLALQEASKGGRAPEGLNHILDSITIVAQARTKGGADELSWRRLISGESQEEKIAREFIRVGIDLDFSALVQLRSLWHSYGKSLLQRSLPNMEFVYGSQGEMLCLLKSSKVFLSCRKSGLDFTCSSCFYFYWHWDLCASFWNLINLGSRFDTDCRICDFFRGGSKFSVAFAVLFID